MRQKRILLPHHFYWITNQALSQSLSGETSKPYFSSTAMARQFVKTLHQCAQKFQLELWAYVLTENGYEILLRPSLSNLESFMKRLHALMNQQRNPRQEPERLFYRCVLVQDEFVRSLLNQMSEKHQARAANTCFLDPCFWYESDSALKSFSKKHSEEKHFDLQGAKNILGSDSFVRSIQIKLLYEKSLSSVA